MANEKHVAILKQGVEVWNQWFITNFNVKPSLRGADLQGADLSGMLLSGVDLREANLARAKLIGANLIGADLIDTDLYRADLQGADLSATHLIRVNLSLADLCGADLHGADLYRADLYGANWTEAICGYTTFKDLNLSQVKGLETVIHRAPSTIGIDTIYRSGGNIPEAFLHGAGIPDNFITFMRSLTGQAIDFYSCFISHSSKDKEFAERLYADLQNKGVRCWYARHDLKIGEPFVSGIDEGIRLYDKLLLVLSEHSVASDWVQFEVNLAMTKEKGKEPWVLFPIRLDDTVMATNVRWANMIRESRHIGDFTQWKDHDSYKKAFNQLLRDLKGKS